MRFFNKKKLQKVFFRESATLLKHSNGRWKLIGAQSSLIEQSMAHLSAAEATSGATYQPDDNSFNSPLSGLFRVCKISSSYFSPLLRSFHLSPKDEMKCRPREPITDLTTASFSTLTTRNSSSALNERPVS